MTTEQSTEHSKIEEAFIRGAYDTGNFNGLAIVTAARSYADRVASKDTLSLVTEQKNQAVEALKLIWLHDPKISTAALERIKYTLTQIGEEI